MSLTVVAIGGSLRAESRTAAALRIALEGAASAGASTELLDLHQLQLPFFDARPDPASYPATVHTLLTKVAAAHGLLLGSPTYQGTMTGAMKNVFDLLELLGDRQPRWLEGKAVGLLSVSGMEPNYQTINHMQSACRCLHGIVLPRAVPLPGCAFDEQNRVADADAVRRLTQMGMQVARFAGHIRSYDGPWY